MVEQLCREFIKIKKIDVVSVFEAVGQYVKKEISKEDLKILKKKQSQGQAHVGECIPLILWLLR